MHVWSKGIVLLVVAGLAFAACSADDVVTGGIGGSAAHGGTGASTATAGSGGQTTGTTSSTTSSATGGAGGVGGGLSGPCNVGDCAACAAGDCALAICDGALVACANNDACLDLFDCIDGCTTAECDYQCHEDHAAGVEDYYGALDCLYCDGNTCSADCVDYCPIEPPPDAPCDQGDCGACGSSDCAYYWCRGPLQACFDDADCLAYESCEAGCSGDPTCIKGCETSHPTGVTLYYRLLSCLYCDGNTCSADCVDYCPIEPPPDAPCDQGDCGACGSSDCAYFWCGPELDACLNDAECLAYESCEAGCSGDPTCIKGCETSHPTGVTLYYGLLSCLYCDGNTCSADCVDYCPIEPPPDAPCDQGDCAACGSSDCAYFWCGPELDACLNDQECLDYESCEYDCSGDATCIQGCQSTYPTGASLYYGLLDCLYCDTNTCAVDCAAYCPIGPPTGGCDQGDCNACINSTCAATACATEVQACNANPDCVALSSCLAGCSNPGCTNQCENQYAAGQADYDAMMSCLTCSPDSCAGDCAAYCP